MKRLTDRNFKLGFDDSNKLPSYESIYKKLRLYENMEEDGLEDFKEKIKLFNNP